MEDDGIEDAAEATAAGGEAVGEGFLCGEVLGEDGDRGDEETAVAESDADALGEDELPVLGADAGHEEAEGDEERAGADEEAKVARIIERSCHDSDEEEQE